LDADGVGGAYTTLALVMSASTNGDTVLIGGSDVDTYDQVFPANITIGSIVFRGLSANPDSFPILRIRNWTGWDQNVNGTARFERVVLENCATFSLTNNYRQMFLEKVILRNYTASPFILSGDHANYLSITNSIFLNNKRPLFVSANPLNVLGPYGTVTNSTFHGNDTIAIYPLTNVQLAANKIIQMQNCIFSQNRLLNASATIKKAWSYSLIPLSETLADWGAGTIQSNNPAYSDSSGTLSKASDFQIDAFSIARDAGLSTGAPAQDISGNPRPNQTPVDLGAYEYAQGPTTTEWVWDTSVTAGLQEGNGTWGTNSYWTQNGTILAPWLGAGYRARFVGDGFPHTVLVNGTQAVDHIRFNQSGYRISGGSLQLGALATLSITSGQSDSITSTILGDYTKEGNGELYVNPVFSGSLITVKEGTLTIGGPDNGDAFNTNISVADGASLQLSAWNRMANTLKLTLNGPGAVFNMNDKGDALGTLSGSGQVINNHQGLNLDMANGLSSTFSGTISGTGDLNLRGENSRVQAGTLVLTGANTYSGTTTFHDLSNTDSNKVVLQLAGGSNRLPISTQLGFGNSTHTGLMGKLILGDVNGPVTQTIAGISDVPGSGTFSIVGANASPSTLMITNNTSMEFSGALGGSGINENNLNLTKSGIGKLTFSGGNGITLNGAIKVSSDTLTLVDVNNLATGASTTSFQIDSAAVLELQAKTSLIRLGSTALKGSIITGKGTLLKTGANALCLGEQGAINFNVYLNMTDGLIDVQQGVLRNGSWNGGKWTLNKAGLNIASGAIFDLWNGDPVFVDELTGSGIIEQTQSPTATAQTMTIGINNGSGIFSGQILNHVGPIAIEKHGTGTQTFTGENTFTGGYTHVGGNMILGHNKALGSGEATLSDSGRIYLGNGIAMGNTLTVGACSPGMGFGALTTGTGNVASWAGPITINANCLDGGHFASEGTGQLNILGPIHSDSIAIPHQRAGTVVYGGGGSANRFNLTEGTARLGAINGLPFGLAWSQNHAILSSTLDLNGFNQVFSSIYSPVNSGTAVISNSQTNRSTLTLIGNEGSSDTTYAGNISGNIQLIKQGTYRQTLSGANTYSGPTIIATGELNVNGSLGAASEATVQAGASLTGSGAIAGTVTIENGGTLSPGSNSADTITIGSLILSPTSILRMELGSLQDFLIVDQGMSLNGKLKITSGPGLAEKTYLLATWSGLLTNDTLQIDSMPPGFNGTLIISGDSLFLSTLAVPLISNNSGGDTATVSVIENQVNITTMKASHAGGDSVFFHMANGFDASQFSLDSLSGRLVFLSPPDFENPTDGNADNIYELLVRATDRTYSDSQWIQVTVTDLDESPILIGLENRIFMRDTLGGELWNSIIPLDSLISVRGGSFIRMFIPVQDSLKQKLNIVRLSGPELATFTVLDSGVVWEWVAQSDSLQSFKFGVLNQIQDSTIIEIMINATVNHPPQIASAKLQAIRLPSVRFFDLLPKSTRIDQPDELRITATFKEPDGDAYTAQVSSPYPWFFDGQSLRVLIHQPALSDTLVSIILRDHFGAVDTVELKWSYNSNTLKRSTQLLDRIGPSIGEFSIPQEGFVQIWDVRLNGQKSLLLEQRFELGKHRVNLPYSNGLWIATLNRFEQ
jgi:autotransporter-associated beta strand protein